MSRPSEPVETTSMSIAVLFLPSRMMEPLPKLRSIWDSAASSAFDLSMDDPSTRRSAAPALMGVLLYGRDSEGTKAAGPPAVEMVDFKNVHDMFSVRNMFFPWEEAIYPLGTITRNGYIANETLLA